MDNAFQALKRAAQRQSELADKHGIVLLISLHGSGILLSLSWKDPARRNFELTKKVAWLEVEQSQSPLEFLNDRIDSEVESLKAAKRNLDQTNGQASCDAVAPYSNSPDIPVWERGLGNGL